MEALLLVLVLVLVLPARAIVSVVGVWVLELARIVGRWLGGGLARGVLGGHGSVAMDTLSACRLVGNAIGN